MRTLKTVYGTVSDWSVVKWSVLIGREQLSFDQMERSDWLIKKLPMGKTIEGFLLPCQRRFVTFQVISDCARFDSCLYSFAKNTLASCCSPLIIKENPFQMFLIGLRTIVFLFYLIYGKKRNTHFV